MPEGRLARTRQAYQDEPVQIRKSASAADWPDYLYDTPEQKAAMRRVAQGWADIIDKEIAEQVYGELYGRGYGHGV